MISTIGHKSSNNYSSFDENGFLHIKSFFNDEKIEELKQKIIEANELLKNDNALTKDNMIFHSNLFYVSEYLQKFLSQQKIIDVMKNLVGPDIFIRWDQSINKYPNGCEFPWHQDNAYSKLKDEYFQLWVALTDMNEMNGGLHLQPGSHKLGDLTHEVIDGHLVCVDVNNEGVLIDARKGDIVIFSSRLLHHTKENKTKNNRWAYVAEYISTQYFDPMIEAPYFIAARNNLPNPKFVKTYEGKNLKNIFRHFDLYLANKKIKLKAIF